ncbi:hypothetical protein F7725_008840 [Dissostichus mawsoni]|uniref:Kringle domain-containing protein n=1 Tax=Dissostichus mawsoni TaxID=36200 RepID=A0A7J5Z732_DISMA|nr:hypothetical protein F7725_008840 [Dissostichus mawsoni]
MSLAVKFLFQGGRGCSERPYHGAEATSASSPPTMRLAAYDSRSSDSFESSLLIFSNSGRSPQAANNQRTKDFGDELFVHTEFLCLWRRPLHAGVTPQHCKGTQMSRTQNNINIVRQCIEGVNYEGNINITKSGRQCQYWTSSFPHPIIREFNASEPDSVLQENFCRNPDQRSEGPWCFTKDPTVQKEPCRVPTCGKYLL